MVFLSMKRSRDDIGEIENLDMANYLMLLSRGDETFERSMTTSSQYSSGRVFECKTCNRQFPSFQALGGHRASHKKPKLSENDIHGHNNQTLVHETPVKPKSHECSICGLEFAIGQALGGHMRRHRATNNNNNSSSSTMNENKAALKMISLVNDHHPTQIRVPVLKKSSSRRFLCMDLNLTPLENDFKVYV